VYTFVLELQEAGDIRLNVIRASGVIEPENAKAQELRFTYAPSVSFSLSDGVKAGDVTPLVRGIGAGVNLRTESHTSCAGYSHGNCYVWEQCDKRGP